MSVPAVFWRINAAAATDRVRSAREFLTLCPNASVADEINLVEKSATASCRTRRPEGGTLLKISSGLASHRDPQCIVDAILPAGTVLLEIREDVAVDLERNEFLGVG